MERKAKQPNNRKTLIVICGVLAVILIGLIVILISIGGKHDQGNSDATTLPAQSHSLIKAKELLVQTVEERGDRMVVTTSYGTIKYAYAFSDLIQIKTETFDYHAQMDFYVVIDGQEIALYTLFFNKNAGIPVGTLTVDGTAYTVTALIYELDQVIEENRLTCQAAQETFNDVMISLAENTGFQAAQ